MNPVFSRHIVRIVATAALLVLASTLPAPAHAQTAPVSDRKEAYQIYKQGVAAYRAEDYERAVELFERAAEVHQNGVVYYNLSLAHSKLGNSDEALAAAKRAASMEEQLPDATVAKNRARLTAYRSTRTTRAISEDVRAREIAAASSPTVSDLGVVGWSGAGVAGTGLVLVTVALIVDGQLGNKLDRYDDARRDGDVDEMNRLYGEITTAQTTGRVAFWSGISLAAVGTGLIVYDLFSSPENQNVAVTAGANPGGAQLGVRIDF